MSSRAYKRSPSAFLPAYNNNAVLQLIIACGVAFVMFHLVEAILWIVGVPKGEVESMLTGNVALPPIAVYKHKWWTLFTYGIVDRDFWRLLSDMIWLYCFGSVVQSLVGYRQVIPIFVYSVLAGGIFFLLIQLVPMQAFNSSSYVLGTQAALVGFVSASVTIAPKYRLYFGQYFSVPILVLAGIFILLIFLGISNQPLLFFMLLGGGLAGFVYIRLLRAGYHPGDWMYNIFDSMERAVTPNAMRPRSSRRRSEVLDHAHTHSSVSQKRIDDILDKISRHGYNSLSNEEKEILMKASKEN